MGAACGDGAVAADEPCDDGNDLPFDGCYQCKREPSCPDGACAAICGDGVVSPGEVCDDGNNVPGDGCSSGCTLENIPGVSCSDVTTSLPISTVVPVIFRDFKGSPEAGGHPDFEHFHCTQSSPGLVQPILVSGAPPKPAFAKGTTSNAFCGADGATDGAMITSAGTFAQWYADVPGVNKTIVGSLTLAQSNAGNTYIYDSAQTPIGNTSDTTMLGFFPLDGAAPPQSWGMTPASGTTPPDPGLNHNYGFTTELHSWFTYQGGELLNFTGDDDVWVFINNRLAVDLGGTHPRQAGTVTLDDATAASLGLVKGNTYEISLFHAERHTNDSNFKLTLGGFVKKTTHCASVCGDGIKAPDEECDGASNGAPGETCSATCKIVFHRPG